MHYGRNTIISLVVALAVLGAVFFGGVYVGSQQIPEIEKVISLINKEPEVGLDVEKTDFSPFWQVWNVINEKYNPGNGMPSNQERVWGAIEGLVGSLDDPYSIFLPPEDAKVFDENIRGNFGGVGIEIGIRDDVLTVISPLKGTPAEKAGILEGDKIIAVNGTSTASFTIDEAVKNIRGEIGTAVTLTIAREGRNTPFDVDVTRDTITIPTIDTEVRDAEGVFILKLYNFSAVSPNLFQDALRKFELSGYDKLVLDLRGNAGGFLQASVEIASWFLPQGKVVVTEDYPGEREDAVHRSKGYDIFDENLRMVILINGGSASASEILAGALSEHGVATLVGEKTFGKGSVQELEKITSGASLKLTVARWHTPDGNSISKEGITPDIIVERTSEDYEEGRDPQLERALQFLTDN